MILIATQQNLKISSYVLNVWILGVNGFTALASNFLYICITYYNEYNDVNNIENMQDLCYSIAFLYGVKPLCIWAQENCFTVQCSISVIVSLPQYLKDEQKVLWTEKDKQKLHWKKELMIIPYVLIFFSHEFLTSLQDQPEQNFPSYNYVQYIK